MRHERLDDEVIAIDLGSGAYFALDDVAADCWSTLVAGGTVDAAVETTVAKFDVAADTAREDVTRFVDELLSMHLLLPSDREPRAAVPADAGSSRREYRAPRVERFDDLEELLVLDPIHEVDDAGWPVTRAAT